MSAVQIMCDALHGALDREQSIEVLKQQASLNGIVALCKRDPQIIVVADGSNTDTLRFLEAASRRLANCRLVVFGIRSVRIFRRRCATVRVNGLVSRGATLKELVHAINSVRDHGAFFSPALQAQSADATRSPARKLTSRERDIAWLISRRLTNKQIAARLRVSEHTVKVHVRHILAKLEARGRSEVFGAIARD